MKSATLKGSSNFILIFFILFITACGSQEKSNQNDPDKDKSSGPGTISFIVHSNLESQKNLLFNLDSYGKMTVFDAMKELSETDPEFEFEFEDYPGMGHLIVGVDGMHNDKDGGKYWQFCVDNVFSDRGVDEVQVGPGQSVDWYLLGYGESPCRKIGE